MKRIISAIVAVVMTILYIPVFAADETASNTIGETENTAILKNTILHLWDFSDEKQAAADSEAMDVPVLSGSAEYSAEHKNVRLTSENGAGLSVDLSEPAAAQSSENIINVEFDVNFGKINKQYFGYSITDNAGNKIIDCNFSPYNSSSAETDGYLKIGGVSVIEAADESSVNNQIVSCISAVNADGMTAETTHFRNEIDLAGGTATVYIAGGSSSGSFTGTFDTEVFSNIAGFETSLTKMSTSRYTYFDNLKISQYQYVTPPPDSELVHYVTAKAEGGTTVVDTSKMVYGGHITSFMVTTAKDGELIDQYMTEVLDSVSVNTEGAENIEIAPVYTYTGMDETKFNSADGFTLKDINVLGEIADGRYNMSFKKTTSKVTDIYVNGGMVVNNAEQPGNGRSNPRGALCEANDVKIEGGVVNIKTLRTEYSGITYPDAPISEISIVKAPSIIERKTKITIMGDSLVSNYYGGKKTELGSSQTGWGQQLINFLDSDKYEIVNLANSGHYARILYETAMSGAVSNSLEGDIILCQVGYNDRVRSNEAEMTEYMTKMAEAAKAAGITIIFVAPPATCDDETKYGSSYANPIDTTAADYVNTSYSYPVRYGETVKETAKKLGAGFIDLSRMSYDYLTSLYGTDIDAARELYIQNIGVSDGIHLSYAGAMKWASFIAQELYDNGYITDIDTEFDYTVTDTEGNIIACSVSDGPATTEPTTAPTEGAVSPEPAADPEEPELNGGRMLLSEDFSDGGYEDWIDSKKTLSIKQDEVNGNYLSMNVSSSDSGAYRLFEETEKPVLQYSYECDVRLKAGNNKSTQLALMSDGYTFSSNNVNYGIGSGYIFKLYSVNSTEWTINPDTDNKTVTIPNTEWVHLKVSSDSESGTTWLKLTNGEDILYSGAITPYSEKNVPVGLHLRGGKNNAVIDVDNLSLTVVEDNRFSGYSAFRNESNVGAVIIPGIEGNVCAALYDGEGRLLGVRTAEGSEEAQTLKFPIPKESGAYMKIFNLTDDMQPLSDASETIDIDSLNEKNSDYLLYGRSVYAFGDSIVFGHTKPEESFMQLIAEDYNMDLAMYAVNGATVVNTDSSEKEDASESKESNYIINQIRNASSEAPDMIVFDGYTNDAYGDPETDSFNSKGAHINIMENLGEIQGSDAAEFDNKTFCGGFEEIIYTMKQKWPDTPIVFVTIHKSGGRDWDIQCKLRELAIQMCDEWGVYVADVFNDTSLDTNDPEQMKNYIINGAGSHPNVEACREFYIPVVTAAMKEASENNMEFSVLPDNINDKVDLAVFAGQSNMSGRGSAADAVVCDINAGFEYKAISDPATLVRIEEPFGLGEDKEGSIADFNSDGMSRRTGSMVSAVVDEYYRQTGRQLVAVSASIGGSSTAEWLDNYIYDAVGRLDAAKRFLTRNGIEIGRTFVVWCQGESDGDQKMTAEDYTANTKDIFDFFKQHGAEKCFMVQTGHYNYIDYPGITKGHTGEEWDESYGVIRGAQTAMCCADEDFVLAGSFEPYIEDMKDRYHYYQSAYNAVGQTVGQNIADFYENEGLGGE